MAEQAVAICQCCTIGAPKEIRFCDADGHHKYWFGDRELTSVSKVIRTVYPTDYSAVDPVVLETARVRGVAVDEYFSAYLTTGEVTVMPGEREDVLDRLDRLIDWWEKSGMVAREVQATVFHEGDGVAGTFDIGTEELIVDLKNVSALNQSYILQLGAYLTMDKQQFPLRSPAILHVTKDKVKLVPYEAKKCKQAWQSAVGWYRTMETLK